MTSDTLLHASKILVMTFAIQDPYRSLLTDAEKHNAEKRPPEDSGQPGIHILTDETWASGHRPGYMIWHPRQHSQPRNMNCGMHVVRTASQCGDRGRAGGEI
jgi:hypothetical protein